MFWKRKEKKDNLSEELSKSIILLNVRVSKLEIDVDNLILRLRKKMFPPLKEVEDNLYKGVLVPE